MRQNDEKLQKMYESDVKSEKDGRKGERCTENAKKGREKKRKEDNTMKRMHQNGQKTGKTF